MRQRKSLFLVGLAAAAFFLRPVPLWAGRDQTTEELETFLADVKPGSFLILELRKGALAQGRLVSYDDYYDAVWLAPAGETGFFDKKSYRLSSIRNARLATASDISDPKRRIDVDSRYLVISPE